MYNLSKLLKLKRFLRVMVNPWTFPEALQVVCDMTPRYLTLAKMGIKKFSLKEFETCFEQLGKGQIGKASFVPN